jgi:hypothetical protein
MSTLREQFIVKRARRINEVSRTIGRELLAEQRTQRLVMEALNGPAFTQAVGVLKKLQAIDFGDMEYFRQAVHKAMADVNDTLGGSATEDAFGSGLSKVLSAVKTKLSTAVRSPIPNALAFASALETVFGQAETLIKHNLSQQLVLGLKNGNIDKSAVGKMPVRKIVGDREDSLENALIQAFMPKGILAKLGLTWKKQYLEPTQAAQAILDAPYEQVVKTARSFKQGPQTAELASQLTATIKASESSAAQTGDSSAAATAGGGTQTAAAQSNVADEDFDPYEHAQLIPRVVKASGVGEEDVKKVFKAMKQIAKNIKKQ